MASVITTVQGIEMHYEILNPRKEETIVFLHGFTGSTKTWQQVIKHFENYRIVLIDLIGHGLTESPKQVSRYSMDEQVNLLHTFFDTRRIKNFTLVGYSMGGRIALSYAIKHSDNIQTLILESASPGLKEPSAREIRQRADDALATKIEAGGIESFVEYWENIALFASQKQLSAQQQREIRVERLAQRVTGLANSLRGIGTGVQASNWDKLSKFHKPVVLLTGELDSKFYQIALEMKALFPTCSHEQVTGVGHAIHVENPQSFATIIEKYI